MAGVPVSARGEESKGGEAGKPQRAALRVASHVVELEIAPRKPPATYEREIQCDLEQPKPRLAAIGEDDEYDSWQDDFDRRYESNMQGLDMQNRPSRKSTNVKTGLVEKTRGESAQKAEQDMLVVNKVTEMPKDEAKAVIASKDFEKFFDNSTRLIERALGQEFDLMEDFFTEADGDKGANKNEKSKLTKKFMFQEQEELNRAITSIDWSPV